MTAPARFRTLRDKIAPRWLTSGEGGLVGYALDIVKDAFVERARLGLMARFPQNDPTGQTTAPPDALAALGRDRRVVKGISETDVQYAARLVQWLNDRRTAGNPFTLMQKLAEYTGPLCSFRTVDVRGNWYSRAADGTETSLLKEGNWDWDGDGTGTRWSRFWVIVYPNGLWTPSLADWGDAAGPDWGEPVGSLGSTATAEQVSTMRFLVNDWKPAGTRCINIILAFDAASFGPTSISSGSGMPSGVSGRWSRNLAGVQVPSRVSTARYLDGV